MQSDEWNEKSFFSSFDSQLLYQLMLLTDCLDSEEKVSDLFAQK